MLIDNVLILCNNADDRPEENASFGDYVGIPPIKHSTGTMRITFGLPAQAESFCKNHEEEPYTLIFAHSRIEKINELYPSVHITHYSFHDKDWYGPAFDKIKEAKNRNDKIKEETNKKDDYFIETVLEQFKQLIIRDSHQKLANHCLTIFGRQLEWYKSDLTAYLEKKYPSLENLYPDSINMVDFFQSLSSKQISEIKSQASASKPMPMIGSSLKIQEVRDFISKVADSNSTVLIYGETGVGKELVANALHFSSKRKDHPYIILNCAALSGDLAGSELFGHEKGAFTGADTSRIGKFEAAHGGTLFLDEIGEMPELIQAKILRVLDGRAFQRVGGNNEWIKPNVRIVAATNRDLEKEVIEGRFRNDLLSRLNQLIITVPPLRERQDDIRLLVDHFLNKHNQENRTNHPVFSDNLMNILMNNPWPRNVRDLESVVNRAILLGEYTVIKSLNSSPQSSNTAMPSTSHAPSSLSGTSLQQSSYSSTPLVKNPQLVLELLSLGVGTAKQDTISDWVTYLRKYQDAYINANKKWNVAANEIGESREHTHRKRKEIGEEIKCCGLSSDALNLLSKEFPDATKINNQAIWI